MNVDQFAIAQKLMEERATLLRHQGWFEEHGCQVICLVSENMKLVLSMSSQTRELLVDGIGAFFNAQLNECEQKLRELGISF